MSIAVGIEFDEALMMDEFLEFCNVEESKALGIDIEELLVSEQPKAIIDNDGKANYFMKLYSQILEEEAAVEKFVKEELIRQEELLKEYKAKKLAPISSRKEFFEGILEEYAKRELQDKKVKTLKLPYGELKIKKQQPKWEYDEATMVDSLKNYGFDNFVKETVKYTVPKTEFKKAVKVEDGEAFIYYEAYGEDEVFGNVALKSKVKIDGVTITPQEDKFEIKTI